MLWHVFLFLCRKSVLLSLLFLSSPPSPTSFFTSSAVVSRKFSSLPLSLLPSFISLFLSFFLSPSSVSLSSLAFFRMDRWGVVPSAHWGLGMELWRDVRNRHQGQIYCGLLFFNLFLFLSVYYHSIVCKITLQRLSFLNNSTYSLFQSAHEVW